MKAKVVRWGHGLAVYIPKPLADAMGLTPGEEVVLEVVGEGMARRPSELPDLLERITEENRRREVDWGPAPPDAERE